MAYIGQRPVVGRYIKLDQISSGFNGSNTDFNMTAGSQAVFPGTARNLLLSLGGVIQEPDTDFTISGSTLTFTTPPVSNTTFFGVIYGDMQAIGTPSDGTVLPISIASSGNFTFPEITLTGDLTIPDKLIHSGDTDTSIRFPSNNTISAQTAGIEAIRITDGQKVSMGSTSLRDVGGGSAQSVFQIEGTSQNRSSISLINNQASASPASLRLGKTRGTSVGAVDAVTNGDNLGQIRFVGSDGTDLENTTAMILGVVNGSVSGNTIPTDIAFETSVTNGSSRAERMRILSSGLVGIGTNAPIYTLDIENSASGDAQIRLRNTSTGTSDDTVLRFLVAGTVQDNFIFFGDSGDANAGQIRYNHNNDFLSIHTNGAESLRIDSSRRLGIGTTNPAAKIHAADTSATLACLQRTSSTANVALQFQNDTSSMFCGLTSTATGFAIDDDNDLGSGPMFFVQRSDGNVGVGTATPDVDFHISGGSSVSKIESTSSSSSARLIIKSANDTYTGVHFGDDADDDTGRIRYYHNTDHMQFSTGASERMRIDSSGNVGIGTTSPQTHLVLRAGNPQFTLEPTANTQTCRLQFCTTDGTIKTSIQGGGSLDTALRVVQNSVETVRIDTSGNVGIGTNSPVGELHVSSGTSGDCELIIEADTDNNDENDNPRVVFRQDGGSNQSAVGAGNNTLQLRNGVSSSGGILFMTSTSSGHTNAVERMRVLSNGNVSIGSTTDKGRLYIKAAGTGSGENALDIEDSNSDELFRVRNDGAMFTGTEPGSPYNFTTSSAANVHIQSSGRMRRSTSSIRYKKDIADASWGLAEVLKLRPVTFKSNGTGENADDKTYGGFTAEDIHDLGLTEFVEYNESNQPDALHYGNMVALMAKAIQELNAKVAALEAA